VLVTFNSVDHNPTSARIKDKIFSDSKRILTCDSNGNK